MRKIRPRPTHGFRQRRRPCRRGEGTRIIYVRGTSARGITAESVPKSAQIYALREIFLKISKKFRFRCNEKAKNIVYIIYGIITGNICTPKGAAGARLSASARDFCVNPNRRCGRHMRSVRNPSEKLPILTFRRKFLRRMRPRTELLHLNREFTLFVPFLIAKSGNLCYDII